MPTARRRLTPEQRREELLIAGDAVIRAMGNDARVEDVVRQAGAAKGTFYVYFETWEEFLLALRTQAFAMLAGQFSRFVSRCETWVDLVGGLPLVFIDMTLSLEGLHPALFHGALAHVVPPANSPPEQYDVIARLARLLETGRDANALTVPDIAATSRFLFALLHEAADLVEHGHGRTQVAGSLQQLLLTALDVRAIPLDYRE